MPRTRKSALLLRASVDTGRRLAICSRTSEAVVVFEKTLAAAERCNDPTIVAESLEWLSWLSHVELDGDRARAYAKRMLVLPVPESTSLAFRLYVRHALATLQLGDASAALAIVEQAERVSREADVDTFTMYLSCKSDVLAALGRDEPALQYARLAADICAQRDDPFWLWQRLWFVGYAHQAAGQLTMAREAYLSSARVSREAGLGWEPAWATARAAWMAFLLGDALQARALIDEARRSPASAPCLVVGCAWIALRIGLATGDQTLVEAAAGTPAPEMALASADAYSIGPTIAAFHDYHRARGDDTEADRLLRLGVERLPSPDSGWALFASIARYGDPNMVAKAQHLLSRFPREHRVCRAYLRSFRAIRALHNGNAALGEHLAGEAQLLFEDIGCAFEAARCLELSGRIAEAQQRFGVMGMNGEVARLRATRARTGRPRGGYRDSQQCREIRAMLAAGATIRGIADRLGVSNRTVKARVADIYDAEGVTSRADLLARTRVSP